MFNRRDFVDRVFQTADFSPNPDVVDIVEANCKILKLSKSAYAIAGNTTLMHNETAFLAATKEDQPKHGQIENRHENGKQNRWTFTTEEQWH